nr:Transcriptional regulator, TetR family [Kibdelosporangium sp. MJ126-NF4]
MQYSGSGDITASLRLLWGLDERPSRGPKPSLTVDRIAAAAIELADEEGLTALSMRRVAAKLGVGTMSLYRYVPSKAELIDVILDRVIHESVTHQQQAELTGETWREKLTVMAYSSRELYLRHKWLLQISAARPLIGPNALNAFNNYLGVLVDTGLTDTEKINTIGLVDGFVTSATRAVIEASQAAERTGTSDEDYWAAHNPFLEKVMATGNYPHIAELPSTVYEEAVANSFDYGLQRVLDGLEVLINSRKPDE